MSFILDALKKSEAERKRQDTPGIANIPQSTGSRSQSRWLWIIIGMLVVNLVVLTGIVFRPSADSVIESQTATVQSPPADSVARELPSTPPPVATAQQTSPSPTGSIVEPVADTPPEPTRNTLALPSFEDLRAQGALTLPDMHVDIHVYSGRPADRFVFVNMSKYRESSTLSEGPTVEEITPEGVVLDYQGMRFLLPRE